MRISQELFLLAKVVLIAKQFYLMRQLQLQHLRQIFI